MCRVAFSEEVSGISFCSILMILGTHLGSVSELWGHPELKQFEKIRDCAHRGGQEGGLEAPRMDFGGLFGSFFDLIEQLLTRHGVRRTWKEQGRSAVAMKQRRTKN